MAFAVVGLGVAWVGALISLFVCIARSAEQRKRFAAIIDVDAEVARLRSLATHEVTQLKAAAADDAARLQEEAQRHRREAQEFVTQAQAEGARLRSVAVKEAESIQREVSVRPTASRRPSLAD